MTPVFRALSIAGSDPSGGAGIQADLKTFSALGCYGMSVITALTAQNTQGVNGIHAMPADFVGQQLEDVLSDIGTDAIKIGMLHDPAIIEVVAEKLKQHSCKNIVLDPVMVAKSGDRLLKIEAISALKKHLFILADLITPNIPETEDLLGIKITSRDDMQNAAEALLTLGSKAVIVKGGHLPGTQSADFLLCVDGTSRWLDQTRIDTKNTHGTGCTFSSAIAANLALGSSLFHAVENAKVYISAALYAGAQRQIGQGQGPVHHFFEYDAMGKKAVQ